MNKEISIKKEGIKVIPIIWMGYESELNYQITLLSRGSKLSVPVLLFGKDTKSLNLKVKVFHRAPDTKAKIIIKGALDDSSRVDFEGLVKIEKGAKGTDTYLGANLLLLSEKASGRAVPNLEIEESDVKAGHGATVGRINDNELFYLMSRGLPREKAVDLIVRGFLQSVIDLLPPKEVVLLQKRLKWI